MKSALSIVAYANTSELRGTIALLETALAVLDRNEQHSMAATYVDHALVLLLTQALAEENRHTAEEQLSTK